MRRLPILALVALVSTVLPAAGVEPASLDELLAAPVPAGEPFRLLRLSERAVYAEFASAALRAEALEGLDPAAVGGSLSGPALTVTDAALAAAYGEAPGLHGVAARFREELEAVALLPAGWERQALITLVATERASDLFDFSASARMEAVAREADAIDQGRSTDPGLDSRLTHFGSDLPSAELFEAWKFDDLPDVVDEAGRRDRDAERLADARRARFLSEAVRALYWTDPSYEATVIEWIEQELRQEDVNLMAQLLQLAGLAEIDPETLVRESAPHLIDPSVLTGRLYRRLESVTVEAKGKGRRLDAAQFPDADLLARAETFYRRFFVADGKGRLQFELTPEIRTFIDARSARVRQITSPHLERLLGAAYQSGQAAGDTR
ncbi:MAG: hypothetical protein R2991_02025 [Thermoanaerobaculia bacterium]